MTHTVWLASYPKSGNTWLRMLIANLSATEDGPADINNLPERSGIASARGPFDELLMIDSSLLKSDEIDALRPRVYEELARGVLDAEYAPHATPPVRFVKVHDAYSLTPKGEPLLAGRAGANGAVVIVRDPRDVAISLAHHNRSSIDDAIGFMNDRLSVFHAKATQQVRQFRQRLRSWSGHIESWLDQPDIPIHLIRYEELKADTAGVFKRCLTFSGREATDEQIRRAVKFADFSELQRQERSNGFRETPWPGRDREFFRRGESGVWRDELNAQQIARIEAAHAPMMLRLGYSLSSAEKLACAG